ncbi:MAG: hypothetical protein NZ700_01160 [Gemmataceae bacterium]|nr:hypothetical protein [Gemmataceae bacterium]MDW8264269.1 hypothetical protein [Gemmataceae bacterium]
MLATFCLRLACGLAAALWLLPSSQVNPRFYRTQFLTILGLVAVASVVAAEGSTWAEWVALGFAGLAAFAASVSWSLEGVPAGRALLVGTFAALAAGLTLRGGHGPSADAFALLDDATSAAVLGSALTAMLMGHSYLIAPTMSLTPLLRLIVALAVALGLRMLVAGLSLWPWFDRGSPQGWDGEIVLWLPVRWGVGFVAPLVLAWMAWQSARIRSTQSATGILYVAVVFVFLGELTSQLLATQPPFG